MVAQQVRALVAVANGPDSVPSTHGCTYKHEDITLVNMKELTLKKIQNKN